MLKLSHIFLFFIFELKIGGVELDGAHPALFFLKGTVS
jgi:hypothetical protein